MHNKVHELFFFSCSFIRIIFIHSFTYSFNNRSSFVFFVLNQIKLSHVHSKLNTSSLLLFPCFYFENCYLGAESQVMSGDSLDDHLINYG